MAKDKPKQPQWTKSQHYVPQLYLRNFTNHTGMMFCYDKVSDKVKSVSTKAAAKETYFYEIPTVEMNAIEKFLGKIEDAWKPLISDLIKSADSGSLTDGQIDEFSPFLVMQWMRTKTFRDFVREAVNKNWQSIGDTTLEVNNMPGKVKISMQEVTLPAVHAEQMFDASMLQIMADSLLWHYWVVGKNDTDQPFYTSDHPVVRRAHCQNDERKMLGARDPGIEYAFPLDSSHILLILERTHFAEWKQYNNKCRPLTLEQVQDYNGLQVMRSCQRVYCAKDDFSVARQLCAAHPEIRDPNRPRVKVISTPIKDMKCQIITIPLE